MFGKDGCHIIYPDYSLNVEDNRITWYGIYYDRNSELTVLLLHERNAEGDHFADDESANEIYSWYIDTFFK